MVLKVLAMFLNIYSSASVLTTKKEVTALYCIITASKLSLDFGYLSITKSPGLGNASRHPPRQKNANDETAHMVPDVSTIVSTDDYLMF